MTSRREFIKKSTVSFVGASVISKNLIADASNNQENFWDDIRNQFPLRDHRVYFNNGTIGPSPTPVLEAVKSKMDELNAIGEYRGQEDSREPVANFIGALPEEISLTHNTTEGINIVASGLPLKKGDEVIMTSHEHAGNALPWLNQIKNRGIVIKVVDPADSAEENLNRINDRFTERTRVVAVPHITCTTGLTYPIKEISSLAHDKGAWMFCDGAHAPGSMAIDMKELGCDFYASCGHKWLLGPSGTGFLYVNSNVLEDLTPFAIGAYSDTGWTISDINQVIDGFVPTAHRFDYGTQSAPLANGLKAAVTFLSDIRIEKVETYISGLSDHLYKELSKIDQIEVLSPNEERSRSSMIAFKINTMDYREFGKLVAKEFRIRMVPESNLNAIRISTHIYNNKLQIDNFIDKIHSVID